MTTEEDEKTLHMTVLMTPVCVRKLLGGIK